MSCVTNIRCLPGSEDVFYSICTCGREGPTSSDLVAVYRDARDHMVPVAFFPLPETLLAREEIQRRKAKQAAEELQFNPKPLGPLLK